MLELPFINRTVIPDLITESMGPALAPVPTVGAVYAMEFSITFEETLFEISLIERTIRVKETSSTMVVIILEGPFID